MGLAFTKIILCVQFEIIPHIEWQITIEKCCSINLCWLYGIASSVTYAKAFIIRNLSKLFGFVGVCVCVCCLHLNGNICAYLTLVENIIVIYANNGTLNVFNFHFDLHGHTRHRTIFYRFNLYIVFYTFFCPFSVSLSRTKKKNTRDDTVFIVSQVNSTLQFS